MGATISGMARAPARLPQVFCATARPGASESLAFISSPGAFPSRRLRLLCISPLMRLATDGRRLVGYCNLDRRVSLVEGLDYGTRHPLIGRARLWCSARHRPRPTSTYLRYYGGITYAR